MNFLIPSRQNRPTGDVIFTLNGEATKRRAAGESIINATIGSLMNDDGSLAVLETSARVVHEVGKNDWAPYAPIPGTPEFAAAVIHDVFRDQPALKAAATAVATPGGTGALRHALMNFLQSGQKMLTTSYYWGPYQTLCDDHERALDTFSMFDSEGTIDIAALDAKLKEHLKSQGRVLLFLNDPCHNPTGYSMTRAEWKSVVACVKDNSAAGPITVLIDMAYYLYGHGADPRGFLNELTPLLGHAALLFAWSASKSFTHYGLRVGALIAVMADDKERAATQAALAYSCRGTWSNVTRGGLVAMTRLLTDATLSAACDAERNQLKSMLNRRVEAFNTWAKPKKLIYPRYEGGFFVTVFAKDWKARHEKMKAAGVFVVPQSEALRVALCSVAEKDIERLVSALAD